jgi:hypothetical protein
MNPISTCTLPAFGVNGQFQTIEILPKDLEPFHDDERPYRGHRGIPIGMNPPALRAIYRLVTQSNRDGGYQVYIGKTTNMKRRVADYLEMVRRLRARYAGHRVVEDKNPYRYVHYSLAQCAELNQTTSIHFYTPNITQDWELERIELTDLSHHVQFCLAGMNYDYSCLNSLPSFKRYTGNLASSRWEEVRKDLPRWQRLSK